MKPQKQNVIFAAVVILLAASLFLNYLQGCHVSKLMEEVRDMEYTQSVLSSQIEEIERMEGAEDE